MANKSNKNVASMMKPGDFPYPLTKGAEESRYLTWLRNHSNYMATRGFMDYLRMGGVLVRGVLINFLILLSLLLVVSLAVGHLYKATYLRPDFYETASDSSLWAWVQSPTMPAPFELTGWVVGLSLLWVVLSPITVVLAEIAGQKKSIERAGSDSSVKHRDWFERSFGVPLLLIAAVALFEALPVLVVKFHYFRMGPTELPWDWDTIFASVVSISVVVMGGASKLLSRLGGAKKKLAMLLIGLLGLLVPLLVILYVTDWMLYKDFLSDSRPLEVIILVAAGIGFPILVVVGIGLVMIFGAFKGSFKLSEYPLLFGLMVAVIIGTGVVGYLVFYQVTEGTSSVINFWIVIVLAINLWLYCRLVVDVNRTSIHGLYRDRLASAYLVGQDTAGDVDIEEDVNLGEIGCHEAGSIAPYHLVNVALNLQGSKDMSIRDRNSDFFIFSKRFIGGKRTGYCRTDAMEQVHPTMSLATAMAISAAAASPNMGRGTNPAMVAFMVLLNVRLGYWLPNPGRLEEKLFGDRSKQIKGEKSSVKKTPPGFSFKEVFAEELVDVEKRWDNVYQNPSEPKQRHLHVTNGKLTATPTTGHGLVGIGFSGGGIRSATINLGIAQVLHERGIFDHVDYMSTVSGGGYLGSSISTLMRSKTKPNARRHHSEIEGVVSLDTSAMGEKIVKVTGRSTLSEQREYRFSRFDSLVVKTGDAVKVGQELIERHDTILDRLSWRVKPMNLIREMLMKLDERHKWVNLSDGGHIENLAGIELLRRRCKFIIIGDGEADPEFAFNGLATLIRYARIDLGIEIDIDPGAIRLDKSKDAVDKGTDNLSREHWAFGTITYPPNEDNGQMQEEGYLLYLKSSYSGDEDEVIKEYRHRNPTFPHESTADQFFNENQFEAYRALGQHIGEKACDELMMVAQQEPTDDLLSSFDIFAETLETRAKQPLAAANALLKKEKTEKQKKWLEDFFPTD